MGDVLLIFWGIGLIGAMFAVIAIIYYIISILSMLKSEIKSYLLSVLITGFFVTINAIVIMFFGFTKLEITNTLWYSVVFLYLITIISWSITTKKLNRLIKNTESKT